MKNLDAFQFEKDYIEMDIVGKVKVSKGVNEV